MDFEAGGRTYSAIFIGIIIGLFSASAISIIRIATGTPFDFGVALLLFIAFSTGTITAFGLHAFYTHITIARAERAYQRKLRAQAIADRKALTTPPTPAQTEQPASLRHIPINGGAGGTLDIDDVTTAETEWRETLATVLRWGEIMGDFKTDSLIKRAHVFAEYADWDIVTDVLADLVILDKRNGVATVFMPGMDLATALLKIESAQTLPLPDSDPPAVRFFPSAHAPNGQD